MLAIVKQHSKRISANFVPMGPKLTDNLTKLNMKDAEAPISPLPPLTPCPSQSSPLPPPSPHKQQQPAAAAQQNGTADDDDKLERLRKRVSSDAKSFAFTTSQSSDYVYGYATKWIQNGTRIVCARLHYICNDTCTTTRMFRHSTEQIGLIRALGTGAASGIKDIGIPTRVLHWIIQSRGNIVHIPIAYLTHHANILTLRALTKLFDHEAHMSEFLKMAALCENSTWNCHKITELLVGCMYGMSIIFATQFSDDDFDVGSNIWNAFAPVFQSNAHYLKFASWMYRLLGYYFGIVLNDTLGMCYPDQNPETLMQNMQTVDFMAMAGSYSTENPVCVKLGLCGQLRYSLYDMLNTPLSPSIVAFEHRYLLFQCIVAATVPTMEEETANIKCVAEFLIEGFVTTPTENGLQQSCPYSYYECDRDGKLKEHRIICNLLKRRKCIRQPKSVETKQK